MESEYGQIAVTFTEADHASVLANSFVLRGVDYYVHAHFFRWDDNSWNLRKDKKSLEYMLHISRKFPDTREVSKPAREKIAEVIVSLFNGRVSSWLGQRKEAELSHVAYEVNTRKAKISEKCKEIETLENEIATIEQNPKTVY